MNNDFSFRELEGVGGEKKKLSRALLLRLDNLFLLTSALLGIAAFGFLDHVTGTELRIYPLYVVPIALVAWRVGPWYGVLLSAVAVSVWLTSNHLAGLELSLFVWIANSFAHFIAFATVVVLVTYLQRSRSAEKRLARADPLTGLPNTRSFNERAQAEIERQKRNLKPLTIAFVDLDNFKTVNDRFGHNTGNRLLSIVADIFMHAVRTTDHLGRLGGDEFAILMPETTVEGARQVLERLQAKLTLAMNEQSWPVSCSIGAVTFPKPPPSVDTMIGSADGLMYQVKESGKNALRIESFSEKEVSPQGQA